MNREGVCGVFGAEAERVAHERQARRSEACASTERSEAHEGAQRGRVRFGGQAPCSRSPEANREEQREAMHESGSQHPPIVP